MYNYHSFRKHFTEHDCSDNQQLPSCAIFFKLLSEHLWAEYLLGERPWQRDLVEELLKALEKCTVFKIIYSCTAGELKDVFSLNNTKRQ